ncbi:MAG: RNA polymerase-binding protein DksA [Betaproteobacteria bacterium]
MASKAKPAARKAAKATKAATRVKSPAAKKPAPAKKVAVAKKPAPLKKPVPAKKAAPAPGKGAVAKKAAPARPVPAANKKTPAAKTAKAAPPTAADKGTKPTSKTAAAATAVAATPSKPAPRPTSRAPSALAPERSASAPNARDVAAAHEYLLARTASRSGEPVFVDGRRLPTEGELLQMSEADYMNAAQLAFFKHRLQQMVRDLTANAEETTEHLRETVVVPDPADRATLEEEHALELRTRDRERKLLKKVQDALQRIDSGEYGFCEETGDPIGIPRLLARPTATLSLEAQQRRELKQKLFGD